MVYRLLACLRLHVKPHQPSQNFEISLFPLTLCFYWKTLHTTGMLVTNVMTLWPFFETVGLWSLQNPGYLSEFVTLFCWFLDIFMGIKEWRSLCTWIFCLVSLSKSDRAENNGRSTDNVWPDRRLDRSNSHLAGHFDPSSLDTNILFSI